MPAPTAQPDAENRSRTTAPSGWRIGEKWRQFWIGLLTMLACPAIASAAMPLKSGSATDYVIFLVGLLWQLLWEPVRAVQVSIKGPWSEVFTLLLAGMLVLMWLTVATLPLLGRWPGRQAIGLWAMQFAYAGAQAIGGYFYVKGLP